ncbi:hypothetical protein DMC63_08645 [Streptomyces sp. WAC 05977]|nr:hypothetical protein DMC63_08645 [Streptomyces sp. WAC 05977]
MPCHDGVITFLSDYTDADGKPRTTVVSWNEGRPVTEKPVDPETFSQKTYDARALRGGHLEWLAADGRIMTTEIPSGVTVPRFGTGFTSDSDSSSQAAFTDPGRSP